MTREPQGTGGFPAQRASNAVNTSKSWHPYASPMTREPQGTGGFPAQRASNAAITSNSWHPHESPMPQGWLSESQSTSGFPTQRASNAVSTTKYWHPHASPMTSGWLSESHWWPYLQSKHRLIMHNHHANDTMELPQGGRFILLHFPQVLFIYVQRHKWCNGTWLEVLFKRKTFLRSCWPQHLKQYKTFSKWS